MKHLNVVFILDAKDDLKEIYHYIAKRSTKNALNWLTLMEFKIASLAQMPERCPIAPENDFFDEQIRHLIIQKNYRILFFIENDFVYILHNKTL